MLHERTYASRFGLKRNDRIETISEKEKCTQLQRMTRVTRQNTKGKNCITDRIIINYSIHIVRVIKEDKVS